MLEITPGLLLISDPFLKDPNFSRSVVLICDHQSEGSIGFVLNKMYDRQLNEMLTDLEELNIPLYYGGPVQKDTIHFLHKRPDLIEGGQEIIDGVFWGGDFECVIDLLKQKAINLSDIRFFIGYSGWEEGQLEDELKSKSWITANSNKRLIFHKRTEAVWKEALQNLGGEYAQMVNYPLDPQLN